MVWCSSRSAQFAPKGRLVASVSKLFISPSCLLLVLWLLLGSVTGPHRVARCVSDPASYIFPFPIRWLHTCRFLWTLLTSAFTHGLPLPLLLFFLSRPHFSPPRALKTSWSCQVVSSTTDQLMRTVNPHPPSPVLNFHPVFILDPPLSLVSCPISPTPTTSPLHVMPLLLWIQLFTPPHFLFASLLNMFMALQGVMGSWFWSDFSLMKTLGGSACPLLPLFFHVQVVMCIYFCVCAHARACVFCLCPCACTSVSVLLKSSPLSVMDDTDLHSDRQEAGKAAGL